MLGAIKADSRFSDLVGKLVQVEKASLNRLESRQNNYQNQLSEYGKLKNNISSFQTSMQELSSDSKFQVFTASSSDSDVLTATTSTEAITGRYLVNVNTLAQQHKIASAAFADPTTSLGETGTIKIAVGSDSFTLDIASGDDTLAAIKEAINSSNDNDYVKATLLNVDDGSGGTETRLVLTSLESGASNTVVVTDETGNVASTLNVSTEIDAAQDASITVDGFTITSASNLIEDAIDGVTLNLKATGSSINLDINKDTDTVTKNIQNFVDAYNDIIDTMDTISLDNSNSSVSQVRAALSSDIRHVRSGLRGILSTAAANVGDFQILSEIGVDTDPKTGKLTLDKTKLSNALTTDFKDVSKLFTDSTEGFAVRLEDYAKKLQEDTGLLKVTEDGLNKRIDLLDKKIEREKVRVDGVKERLTKQFGALDVLVTQMESTQSYLSQELSNLVGSAGGGKK